MDIELGEVQTRFAELIWRHAPIASGELVKLCEKELNWKKPTTYTVLRKLCEKGLFRNEGGRVTAAVSREEFYRAKSRRFVAETFDGSLPAFLAAFTSGEALSEGDVRQIQAMIDAYRNRRENMRRKDREVTNLSEILKIVDRCPILRIGLADGDIPYIVPLNFAYTAEGGELTLYVHGAMAGRKYELMRRNGSCAFEMDVPLGLDLLYDTKDVTMRYESVMGTARIDFLEGEEKRRVMEEVLLARDIRTRAFDYNRKALDHTAVARLTVLELTAKANPFPPPPGGKTVQ